MPQEPGALTGIVDIETPVAPLLATGDAVLAAAVALLLLAAIGYLAWRRYSTPHARARRRLRALRQSFDQRQLDGRRAAFELAAILREAFGVSHLSVTPCLPSFRRMPAAPPPLKKGEQDNGIRWCDENTEARWRDFVEGLSTARYAAPDIHPAQLDKLFRGAHEWLRRKP